MRRALGVLLATTARVGAACPATAQDRSSQNNWTGFYLGANLGGDRSNANGHIRTRDGRGPINGPGSGIHGGYNYQINSFVLGGDANWIVKGLPDSRVAALAPSLESSIRCGLNMNSIPKD